MQPEDIGKLILAGTISLGVLIPIIGITARITLRPVVEAIARLRESGQSAQAVQMLERRMDLLEQEMHGLAEMKDDVAKLVEAQEFQLKLASPTLRDTQA